MRSICKAQYNHPCGHTATLVVIMVRMHFMCLRQFVNAAPCTQACHCCYEHTAQSIRGVQARTMHEHGVGTPLPQDHEEQRQQPPGQTCNIMQFALRVHPMDSCRCLNQPRYDMLLHIKCSCCRSMSQGGAFESDHQPSDGTGKPCDRT